MKTTLLGIKFNILDLDAKYEVIGTSDNYSFQYELGKGRDLIGQENYQYVGTFLGSEYSTSIDLLGNYGTFLVKVFAVSDLGIRSEFISSTVDIEAPRFDGTFSFGSIQVADKEDFLESKISKPPTPLDNELVCSSSFSDNSIVLEWKIVPPPGHTEEGVLIGNDIVNDPFFDRFEVSIRNGVEEVLITEDQLNASVSLVSDFSTVDVASHLNNYKKCSLNLSSSLFDELDLDRSITVEIKCFDSFGQISSGKIYLENQKPAILNFNQFELKNKQSFSWIGEDSDYKYSKICYIGIVSGIDLPVKNSVKDSVDYFNEIALAQEYQNVNNKFYKKDDIVRFENYIFQCKVDHYTKQNGEDTSTSVEAFWEELFISPQFIYREVSNLSESFEVERMFGYNYFFEIVPYDGYGEGDVYSLTETGLFIKTDSTELAAFGLNLFIGDTTFRERGEDLVFSWKFFDHLGNKINLAEYTSVSRELGHPEVLGVQGVLFDSDSREVLASISEKGSSILADGYGGNFLIPNLGIIDNFEYTRKINNTIYGTGGFPAGVTSFDEQYLYTPDGEVTQTYLGSFIFSSNIQNSIDSNSPRIKPIYDTFNSNQTYLSSDDDLSSPVVDCDGSLYKVIKDFGPESIFIKGLFDETLSYSVGDLVACPKNNFSIFNASRSYEVSDLVSFDGKIYICAKFQSTGNAVYPNVDDSFWLERGIKSSLDFAIFECLNDLQHPISQTPNSDVSNWQIKDPKNAADYFEKIIDSYGLIVGEWSEELSFTQGNLCVYNNDIWIALDSSGPFFDSGFKTPGQSSAYWSNLIDNSDITTDHSAGDLVFYNGVVYKCLFDNPTGPPLSELKSSRQDSHSNYEDCGWSPFWILDDTIEYSVFGHVGIPEGGKRNVGLRLNLVSYNGEQMPEHEVIATNPPPRILPQGFSVDSTSMASRVRFNFNYDQGFQEKTTKVNLYRSSFPDFDITGSDKFPLEHIGADSTFVKSVLGAGDATFGDNITEIFDDPPLYVNSEGIEEATGYYYKILPFDDFGSGDLFGVNPSNDGGLDKIIVYPKNFHSQNPTDPIGEIPKASQPNLGPDGGIILYESIPGPAQNLTGDTAFVNYFLNWDMPTSERDENDNFVKRVPNDIDYYEIWESTGKYINYSLDGGVSSSFLNQTTNLNGYRRIIGDLESYGDVPLEAIDIAESIVGAKNIFDVDARSLSLETTYKGEVNDRRYFWVRPVDFAGNKGPFTGAKNFDGEYVEGLELTLGQAKTTDIADFEQNITKTFPNTVALVPNNPFKNQDPNSSSISWESHYLYNNGTGYYISAGSTDDKFLYFTGSSLELTEDQKKEELKLGQAGGGTLDDSKNNPLRNVVFTGDYDSVNYHPAGQGQGTDDELPAVVDDSDFIIARNVNGVASPMWHAFANALIGSAHIENAAITNAKIHNLTADKIRSAEIKGQDIQVGGTGQIRSFNFPGLVNPIEDQPSGFAISGDGTFIFAADKGRLRFDDSELVLEGKLKQVDGREYTFIDLDASPDSFFYSELSDGTYVSDGPQTCEIRASFQNSFVQENQVRFRVSNPNNGYEFIKYSDFNDNPASATYGKYDISGFKYDPTDGDFVGGEPKVATAEFNVAGFNQMINTVDPQLTTIIVSASGLNTSTERSIPINFVADGAAAVYAELKATQQVYSYDYDGKFNDANSNLNLEATAHNTHGNIEFLFETGVNLDSSSLVEKHKVTKNDGTASFQLADFADHALQYYSNTPFVAKLTISDEDGELASDFVSIFGTLPGKDSYTVFLTNENHTYPANENGLVHPDDLEVGKTQVRFFRGTEEYRYDEAGSADKSFSLDGSIISSRPNSVTAKTSTQTVNDFTKLFVEIDDYPDGENEGTFTIKVKDNQYKTAGTEVTFEKIYTYSKSIEAAKGRTVELSAGAQAIKYDTAGDNPTKQKVEITAFATNFIAAAQYEFFIGNIKIQNKKVDANIEINIPATHDGTATTSNPDDPTNSATYNLPVTIECKAYDTTKNDTGDVIDTNPRATDQITIFGLKEGSNAITVIQSQQFVNVPVKNDSSGGVTDVDVSNTENILTVFDGTNQLNYKSGSVPTDIDDGDIGFYVAATSSSLTVTSGAVTGPPKQFKTSIAQASDWITSENSAKINYAITVIDYDKQKRELAAEQNLVKTFDGTIARKVDLLASKQAVKYNTAGKSPNPASITLTAKAHNTVGTVAYIWEATGGHSLTGTGSTRTFSPPSDIFNPIKIKVKISENGTSGTILAEDEVTIYAIQDGSDVITAILSNEAHTLPKSFNNIVDYSGSGTTIQVYQGTTELDVVDDSTTLSAGKYKISAAAAGIQANRSTTTLNEFDNASNLTADAASITFTIEGKDSDGKDFSIVKTQTFSISQEGEHARKVDLTGDQAVKYNTAGSSPDPNAITLTATALNQRTNSTLLYKYTLQDDPVPAGSLNRTGYSTNNTVVYTPKSQKFKVDTVTVEMREDGIDVAKDTLSIYGIQDGSDVITAILSNEAHSFTADSDGNVLNYDGGQTSIQVFQGATELNFSIADVGSDASKYNVAKTEGGINAGNLEQQPGSNGCRTPSVSNMAGNSASIDFTITGRNDEGIEFGPINKVQTFSKSIAGEGEIGNRGVGVVFRGLWERDKIYIGATETSDRGDVVFYDDENPSSFKYWIAQEDHTGVDFVGDKLAGKWESFGAEFESVATDLLLAKDAVITHTLTMGQGDTNGTEYVGHGGLIKTVGKEFGNGVTGFFLGNTGNPPNPQFDVGGESSFIRFDGDSDRVEIKGSLIINSRDDSNLNINSIDGEDATFIGGGYNNSISGLGSSIVGGGENDISGRFSFIGGGFNNNMGDNFSAIVAGYNNEMPNTGELHQGANLIGAGIHNIIDGGTSQTIVNGSENLIHQTGNVGDELVAFDGQQGWLSPGFLGTFSGYGGGGLAYNKSANFVDGLAGWVENSWWPSYKKDWGVNTLSNVFYIGSNRGISQGAWVYHTDLKWCNFSDQSSEVYNDAEYRIYDSLYGKAYPNKDTFYIYMASFDPDFRDFYFWYKDEGLALVQSGGSLGLGIKLYRHILPAAYDATNTYVAGALVADPVDSKYYKSTNGAAAGGGVPSSTAGWTVADDISSYGWYLLLKDNNSEIKLYHYNTQQLHSPISVSVDTDGDGVDDYLDLDDDGDGIPDVDDDFPLDSTEDTDTDGDNIGDNADTDDDGDGVSDDDDNYPLDPNKASGTDTDGDGQDDEFDEDDDGDGLLDINDNFSLDAQQAQAITWNNNTSHNLNAGSFSLEATSTSGLTLSYTSSNTSIATVNSSGLVTPLTGGAFTITISAPANASYFAASLTTASITVIDDVTDTDDDGIPDSSDPFPNQVAQTISWNNSTSHNLSDGPFSLEASTDSVVTLTYASSNTSIATVDASGLVTPLTGGAFTITISAPANAGYFAASLTSASITVIDDVTDTDGDGVVDLNDNFPNNPNRASGTDTDGDGIDDEFEIFTPVDEAQLKTAVDEWIDDEASAVIKYKDINTWNVSNVTNMRAMFHSATFFNQDISSWDVSNVTDMAYMFYKATSFNQDISSWNVSNVTSMIDMFNGAASFDQDLSSWDFGPRANGFGPNMHDMFEYNSVFGGPRLSVFNYDALLNSIKNHVEAADGYSGGLNGGGSYYSINGLAARNYLSTGVWGPSYEWDWAVQDWGQLKTAGLSLSFDTKTLTIEDNNYNTHNLYAWFQWQCDLAGKDVAWNRTGNALDLGDWNILITGYSRYTGDMTTTGIITVDVPLYIYETYGQAFAGNRTDANGLFRSLHPQVSFDPVTKIVTTKFFPGPDGAYETWSTVVSSESHSFAKIYSAGLYSSGEVIGYYGSGGGEVVFQSDALDSSFNGEYKFTFSGKSKNPYTGTFIASQPMHYVSSGEEVFLTINIQT